MVLNIFSGGDVALVQRREVPGDLPQGLELVRRDPAEGKFHPDHLGVRLPLAVDPALEAVAHELFFVEGAAAEPRRLGLEVVELLGQYRNHRPGLGLIGVWRGFRAHFFLLVVIGFLKKPE